MNAAHRYRRVARRWQALAIVAAVVAAPLVWVRFPLDFIPAGLAGLGLLESMLYLGKADGWEERDAAATRTQLTEVDDG